MLVRALLAVLISTAAPAAAQDEPATSEARERARVALDRGNEAFTAHDYGAALVAFQEAFAAAPVDQIRFNIARCFERLGRFREATLEYRAAANSDDLSAEQRARAQRELDAVEERLGTLVVRGPPGVELEIDAAFACTIPCREQLDPGEHRLRGPTGAERRVSLERGGVAAVQWTVSEAPDEPAPGRPVEVDADDHEPGGLSIAGGVVGVVGIAGIVGFGLRVNALVDRFDAEPSNSTADEGELMATLANASIGVAVIGASLVLVDLLLAL